ncbi:5-amino-6-(D-ribitylamino)uracil--L-tyrosine 4-hydroxyphenyl transferase CofH [Saccharopolyspora shandongensis]|uniref:5-amino-6-(D-ribitylamino)uracil--L-tyrosine 4-hydroxyphenyl transferase CofH n=1 Tax=Saccharopolyspora shandongensis TaxID=418495 RepID=UPI00344943E5
MEGTTHDLLRLPLAELQAMARERRDRTRGTTVTYSPKVFIPLTKLCRDRCGYCTFATGPRSLRAPYLTRDEVLRIAVQGSEAGCHEALFTLGERPELRYPGAQRWLTENGYGSTVDYLAAMCAAVLAETGLLPHVNAGALTGPEMAALRPVSASQGMMVESLVEDLPAHRGAPDKDPARRLATLRAAGELGIPFTTGILVGIGERDEDWIPALQAIAEIHQEHGHIQEVIVQNFLPKADTAMRDAPPCSPERHQRAIALARLLLPDDVHLQAPPNLSDDPGVLLDCGIDDWGGVSPITSDHVNPERPWPHLDRLAGVTEERGHRLVPRLPVYPEFAANPERWLHEELRFPVLDRSDAAGLGRDDPGPMFPERVAAAKNVGDGAEVVLIGRRSGTWVSGGTVDPPVLVPGPRGAVPSAAVREVLDGHAEGHELGIGELVTLLTARGPDVAAVAEYADHLRAEAAGDDVTYVRNRNINYTNVCTFRCRFCGFAKGQSSLNLRGKPYLLGLDDIAERTREAWQAGATEVCLQGGIHPKFDGDYYIDVTRAVKDAVPDIHVHGFTALEVFEGARRLDEPLRDYLRRLADAGLRSLPGTAAEILDEPVRRLLCPDKISTEKWLECHETAHEVGLRSNVTMMFGAIEQPVSWARHFIATRDLQRRTGGFTEFVGLPFVHMAAPMYLRRQARRGPTWREVLLVHAVARIVYRGLIDNVQASWVKLGAPALRQLLQAGVNDLGGTLMDENISRAAGAAHGQMMSEADFAALLEPLGRGLVQRTTLYQRVPDSLAVGA